MRRGEVQRSHSVNKIGIVFPEFRLMPSLGVAGKYISLSKIQDKRFDPVLLSGKDPLLSDILVSAETREYLIGSRPQRWSEGGYQ